MSCRVRCLKPCHASSTRVMPCYAMSCNSMLVMSRQSCQSARFISTFSDWWTCSPFHAMRCSRPFHINIMSHPAIDDVMCRNAMCASCLCRSFPDLMCQFMSHHGATPHTRSFLASPNMCAVMQCVCICHVRCLFFFSSPEDTSVII